MEAKFKVGDMVRVVRSGDAVGGSYHGADVGDVFAVTGVDPSGVSTDAWEFYSHEIELVSKFKVGDRVVSRDYMFGKDCYGTVDSVDGNGYVYATDRTVGCPYGRIHSADIELAPTHFKAGDVIRVTTDQDTWVYSGMAGAVIKTAKTNMQVDFGNDKVWWVDYVNSEAAQLRIHAGKYYVDTTGKRVGPMEIWSAGVEHMWCAEDIDGDIYRVDGSSDYGPNLVREWVIEAGKTYIDEDGKRVGPMMCHRPSRYIVKPGDGRVWLSNGGVYAGFYTKPLVAEAPECAVETEVAEERADEPKFKVGDVVDYVAGDEIVESWSGSVITSVPNGGDQFYHFEHPKCGKGSLMERNLRLHVQQNTAIVAKLTNGEPRPSLRPYVHANVESAKAEAQRLADMTPGTEFAVYERVDVRKVEKKYDHEWQRLAAGGLKIGAIKELRTIAGLDLKTAKDAVESWLQAA